MKMTKALTTIRKKVESILERSEQTRDSDKILWLSYLNVYHDLKSKLDPKSYQTLKEIIMCEDTPTVESITRIRRKIQEEGHFLGKNRDKRLEESKSVRDWARK